MTDEQKKRKNECAKQNRQWKKERHLCTCCGKQDAYTLVGRSFCYECCEKERKRKRSNQAMSKIYAQRYEKYHKNIALGICPICGKWITYNTNRKYCEYCGIRLDWSDEE